MALKEKKDGNKSQVSEMKPWPAYIEVEFVIIT